MNRNAMNCTKNHAADNFLLSLFAFLFFILLAFQGFSQSAQAGNVTSLADDSNETPKSNQHGLIDIGIFQSSVLNTIDIKIRPDFLIPSGGVGISEIRYTVRWPESDIEIDNISVFPFFLLPVGSPELYEGYYYQVFANPSIINGYAEDINPLEEVVVASFEYSGDEMDFFEIIINDWTQNNNGDFFAEFRGENRTGSIYQPIVSGTERLVDIKVFLEGAYSNAISQMQTLLNDASILPHSQPYFTEPWLHQGSEYVQLFHADVVDWVLLDFIDAEYAEAASEANSFHTKALLLKKNGEIVNQNNNAPSLPIDYAIEHSLFIIVRHRNHIDIMNSEPLAYDASTSTYSYDFRLNVDKVYGGQVGYKKIGDIHYGMVAGDSNGDNVVNVQDFNQWRQKAGSINVYNNSDFGLSGDVNVSDFNLWRRNAGISAPF